MVWAFVNILSHGRGIRNHSNSLFSGLWRELVLCRLRHTSFLVLSDKKTTVFHLSLTITFTALHNLIVPSDSLEKATTCQYKLSFFPLKTEKWRVLKDDPNWVIIANLLDIYYSNRTVNLASYSVQNVIFPI